MTYKTYWETYPLPSTPLKAWIQAGSADQNVPYTQSENFARRLAAKIGSENVHFGIIQDAAHMDKAFYTEENFSAIFDFFEECIVGYIALNQKGNFMLYFSHGKRRRRFTGKKQGFRSSLSKIR